MVHGAVHSFCQASTGDPKGLLADWNDVTMPSFARPILLPIPTVCCINGHAFGAGLMHALGHDYRMQVRPVIRCVVR